MCHASRAASNVSACHDKLASFSGGFLFDGLNDADLDKGLFSPPGGRSTRRRQASPTLLLSPPLSPTGGGGQRRRSDSSKRPTANGVLRRLK